MNLDVRTMYMAMAVACFIVAIAIFAFHAGRFRRDGALSWTVGWVLQGAFWALIGLRGIIWNFISVVIASTFLAASFSLLCAAVREFQGRTSNRKILLLPPVVTFVFFWYFSVTMDNIFYRVIFISLLSILQITAIAWALFRDASIREKRSCRITGAAFLVMGGMWIHRLLEGFTLPYGHLSVLEATTFRNASVLVGLSAIILSCIGFMFMTHERGEQKLREGEEQLRQSEEKSRLLIKYAPSMIYEVDYNRAAFKSVNDAMCQFLGYTREELLAMSPFDLLDDEGKALFQERIRRKFAGEEINNSVEYKSKTKDGREVYSVLNMTFTYKDGKPEGAVVVAHDITERKRAEQQIARVTKLYSVLSRVNETIVRTRDEGSLYVEVCHIVAQEGGFPLVWVGQIKGKQVTPMAFHGPAADYLKEIRVEIEGELGKGPTGTCIRENRSVINDNFDTNPLTTPWRKPALAYGFRSSAAFPLHRQGSVVGALTLYAPEPGTFDTEHIKLLESLCADISYALDAMQEEKRRSEAEETLRHRTFELQQLTETLEMRVQERTEELETINEELRAENEERLRVEIDLRESENRLRELSSALLNAQERERKLIAGEIHDSMGASLAATKFKVESALKEMGNDNPQTKAALESVVPIIQGTIEEARRIQMSLRPSMLDDLGILTTINWFCRQYESTYSNIRVKREIDIQEHEVPESLKIVIYRVLQEALNNIAKHSKADRINLLLRKMDGAIELGIQDNGQGFDLLEAQSRIGTGRGLGLDSMRERAELSGGSFSIESSKGAGTVIRATWPLDT